MDDEEQRGSVLMCQTRVGLRIDFLMRRVSSAEIKFIVTTGSRHPHEPLFPVDSTKGLDSFVRDTLPALRRIRRIGG